MVQTFEAPALAPQSEGQVLPQAEESAPAFVDAAAAPAAQLAEEVAADEPKADAQFKPEFAGPIGSVGKYSVDLKSNGTVVASVEIDAVGYLVSLAEKSSNKVVKFIADKLHALRKA